MDGNEEEKEEVVQEEEEDIFGFDEASTPEYEVTTTAPAPRCNAACPRVNYWLELSNGFYFHRDSRSSCLFVGLMEKPTITFACSISTIAKLKPMWR